MWLAVFALASGEEVGRARNVYEMERKLQRAPADSIAYHASHHDFSVWLKARGMFDLAAQLRPRTYDEFAGIEELRAYLYSVVGRAREMEQEGIGPGRWGTSDPNLGIPIRWRDIAGVRVIVETPLTGRHVEPSQGSHFFRNMVTERVAYLAVGHDDLYDRAFFDAKSAAHERSLVRHVILDTPLDVRVDGREGRAVVLAPAPGLSAD